MDLEIPCSTLKILGDSSDNLKNLKQLSIKYKKAE